MRPITRMACCQPAPAWQWLSRHGIGPGRVSGSDQPQYSLQPTERRVERRKEVEVSSGWDRDDLARLLALEHAFCALTLISASNFAYLAETTPSAAVKQFREAIEGSVYDTGQASKETKAAMKHHLKRMFDHIAEMAKHAGQGTQKS